MRRYAVIEKLLGETPLQAMEAYRASDLEAARVPLTYAGRLDPMAQGKLLVLIGEECKKRAAYDGLDKEYIFEVLLGFSTDTGDILGLASSHPTIDVSKERLQQVASSLIGEHELPYPAYSSKPIDGKPLFQYALEGKLDSITIPTVETRVYSMEYMDKIVVFKPDLIERILAKIDLLRCENQTENKGKDTTLLGAGFRKEEICKRWWSLEDRRKTPYTIARFKAVVSSGTYIRTLSSLIAHELGTEGVAYSIKRTRMGRYIPLTRYFGFWLRQY